MVISIFYNSGQLSYLTTQSIDIRCNHFPNILTAGAQPEDGKDGALDLCAH